MSAMKFNSFEKCKPKELVRFSDRTGTHWALVGDRGNARLMLLVLSSGKDGPHCINIMGPMDMVRHPYENAVVLSYGTEYSAHIDHAGHCEVGGEGKLIGARGSLVLMETDRLICCRYDDAAPKKGYYSLGTGKIHSELGGARAVFADWELVWFKSKDEKPIKLLQAHAKRTPIIVAPVSI